MTTLIELYDERPIENVLSTVMFRPQETIYVCSGEVARNTELRESLIKFFDLFDCKVKVTFCPVSIIDANKIERELRYILATHKDCAIDISGGTDAALFAAGVVSGDTPVFTYSHRRNTFFEIKNAPYAQNLKCPIKLSVQACFLMAGGNLLPGRENNDNLTEYLSEMETLFDIYSDFRSKWNRQISHVQKISSGSDGDLNARGPRTLSAGGHQVSVDLAFLYALSDAGFIQDLNIQVQHVSYRFPNERVRFWLRDMGAVLELHVYRACILSKYFDDVVLSAVVTWKDESLKNSISNEIDVVAVKGVRPIFISCKTCEVRTEALNELAILRDRFGGYDSRAIIVSSVKSSKNQKPMLMRAAELGIEVIDWEYLQMDRLIARLKKKF